MMLPENTVERILHELMHYLIIIKPVSVFRKSIRALYHYRWQFIIPITNVFLLAFRFFDV